MEEYAISSLAANRQLLRKRKFLNRDRSIDIKNAKRRKIRQKESINEARFDKIQKEAMINAYKILAVAMVLTGILGYAILNYLG